MGVHNIIGSEGAHAQQLTVDFQRDYLPPFMVCVPEHAWVECCQVRNCFKSAGQAIETPFRPRQAAEGEPAPSTKLPLQELGFAMPSDSDIAALVFVVRSGDRSAWYRCAPCCAVLCCAVD